MHLLNAAIWCAGGLVLSTPLAAQPPQQATRPRSYPPVMSGAKAEVYKTIGGVELNIYLFTPKDHQPGEQRPAIVFFFGGGWRSGSPKQFEQQCLYLASRGMVALAADYRVAGRHGVKAVDCVADAHSAVQWIRRNSARLGIDPERIVAAGGSAGGHLAACTGTMDPLEPDSEARHLSSRPNAMVLFNPALVLAPVEGRKLLPSAANLADRLGVEPQRLSPYHHIARGQPPTIIFHGRSDATVPYQTAEWFTAAMQEAGNRCELVGYEDQAHGFFNFGRSENKFFLDTLARTDRFLTSLGYLQGEPSVAEFFAAASAR